MFKKNENRDKASPFRNLRIGHQINLIALLALFGFLAIGGIYLSSSSRLAEIHQEERSAVQAAKVAQAVKYQFLNARRREKDFLIRLQDKYAGQHGEVAAQVFEGLDRLAAEHDTPEVVALAEEVRAGYGTYDTQFKKVADQWHQLGLTEDKGLRGALRNSVHAIEKKLGEFDLPELQVLMLMMRRHEKDFMARLDKKYLGRMDDRAAEFVQALAGSPLPSAEKSEFDSLLSSYQKDFQAFAGLRLQSVDDIKVLSRLFAEVDPKLTDLVTRSEEDMRLAIEAAKLEGERAFYTIAGSVLAVTALVLVLAQLIGRGITGPISRITGAMGRLAERDMEVEIPAQGWRNEIGSMSSAVQVFKDNMIEADRLAEEQQRQQEARAARAERIENLCSEFDSTTSEAVKSVATAATEMQSSSESMNATAEETARQSAAVASASDETSANVQTVATATEELSNSIFEIGRQISKASQIASAAVAEADDTNTKVQGLAEASHKIGEVVALITDIADQTNLLALNATIEAARAGDAGKGFAVVASEVKNLANQTAKATDEIGAQISGIQASTEEAVAAIEKIGKTIVEIDEVAAGIASAVEEQGAATQEIARNVEQAAAGTQEVSKNISGVNAAANDTGAAAAQIKSAADRLSRQSEKLRAEVGKFLTEVKAA